jgi:galactonate dehydratase
MFAAAACVSVRASRSTTGRGPRPPAARSSFPTSGPAVARAQIAEAIARVGALRDALGAGIDIGVEIHRRLSPADAIVLAAALEPFRPLYYEDPIAPDSVASHADLARAVRLPIATGERLNSLYEFRELLVAGGARYVRVDPMLAGGLSSAKKIASLAESFHASVIPHGVTSTVGTAVSVQLDACIPNFVL